jgi:hypothetical protein
MSLYDDLRQNFLNWAALGCGQQLYEAPVKLEPPFVLFPGHRVNVNQGQAQDTGERQTFFSRLIGGAFTALQSPHEEVRPPIGLPTLGMITPEPNWLDDEDDEPQDEIQISLPPEGPSHDEMAAFLTALTLCRLPVSFEFIGNHREIIMQFVCSSLDTEYLTQQIKAIVPEMKMTMQTGALTKLWEKSETYEPCEAVVIDFGLQREFMRMIGDPGKVEIFVSLLTALSELRKDEVAIYQVMFTPTRAKWGEEMQKVVTRPDGNPFIPHDSDLIKETKEKSSQQLFAVCFRLVAKSPDLHRTFAITRCMAGALKLFTRQGGQALVPLKSADYSTDEQVADVLARRTCRSGMIFALHELVRLVHWPRVAPETYPKLRQVIETNSRPAPVLSSSDKSDRLILGLNCHEQATTEVEIGLSQRLQHLHILGATGTGKSTLLLSLIFQDLEAGRGLAVIDPHGDLIETLLENIPPHRIQDVIVIDPSDEEHITPFNVLEAHSEFEKTLLASDLVSVFRRLSSSWGDRMEILFQQLVLAFLDHPEGGTLADMRQFLIDPKWRERFLSGVTDENIRLYWKETFPRVDGQKSIGPILTRLEALLTPKPIRAMVSQKKSKINFSEIMDEGKILLVKLPMGLIGRENSFMLGSLIMVKIQQLAMSRTRMATSERRPFFTYVDEVQNFVSPSLAEILSGGRKFQLGITLAHQDLHQLTADKDVAAAVMTNVGTRVVFRISDADARTLKPEFAHYEAEDFTALEDHHALCRLGRATVDFNLEFERPKRLTGHAARERASTVVQSSRRRYTIPRDEAVTTPVPPREPADILLPAVEVEVEQEVIAPAPVAIVPVPTEVIDHPGKGGQEHREYQQELKRVAESLGFRVILEQSIGKGKESVDAVLLRDDLRIACEISVTTPLEHELGNARKCLKEGFSYVVLISEKAKQRDQAQIRFIQDFTEAERKILRSFSLASFVDFLSTLKPTSPDEERRIKGFKIKRTYTPLTTKERLRITEEAYRLLQADLKVND